MVKSKANGVQKWTVPTSKRDQSENRKKLAGMKADGPLEGL